MKYIPLTHGEFAIIDDDDFERVNTHKWFYSGSYAQRIADTSNGRKSILLHRFVMDATDGIDIDHINGKRLDCRKSNLRNCNRSQNQANSKKAKRANTTSKYKGVSINIKTEGDTQYVYWRARIFNGHKQEYLGSYCSEEEAALAYDKKAREIYGEFAKCNFPNPGEAKRLNPKKKQKGQGWKIQAERPKRRAEPITGKSARDLLAQLGKS